MNSILDKVTTVQKNLEEIKEALRLEINNRAKYQLALKEIASCVCHSGCENLSDYNCTVCIAKEALRK